MGNLYLKTCILCLDEKFVIEVLYLLRLDGKFVLEVLFLMFHPNSILEENKRINEAIRIAPKHNNSLKTFTHEI